MIEQAISQLVIEFAWKQPMGYLENKEDIFNFMEESSHLVAQLDKKTGENQMQYNRRMKATIWLFGWMK